MKRIDFSGVSCLALAMALGLSAGEAVAQAAATPQDATGVTEIIVTGTRAQNRDAIAVRRNSLAVVDSATSDEVGRLPDFNIAEAVDRLPGIAVETDQAEGRFVTIRGLNPDYNYTTVDGVSIAVPDRNGRRVFMDVLPASLAERIDVYKTRTSDQEGAAIGGILDIRTTSAFGRRKHAFNGQIEIGQYEYNKGSNGSAPSGDADFTYSTTFGRQDQFGLVLFGNFYQRDSYIPQTETGGTNYFYTAAGATAGQPGTNTGLYPGTGFAVPGERRWYWYHNDRQRYGGGGKLEWKPGADHYFFARGFWNTATDDEDRQTDLLRHSGGGTLLNQTATSGTLNNASQQRVELYLGQFAFERTVWATTVGGDHTFGDNALKWRANTSGSTFRNPENWAEWRLNSNAGFSYERRGDLYAFTPTNPTFFNNPVNYQPFRRQFDDRQLNEDLYEGKVDYNRDLDAFAAGWRFAAGLSYRRVERDFNEDRDIYSPVNVATNTYTLAASGVLREDLCLRPPGALPGQCMRTLDPGRATANWAAHFAANPTQWRLDPLTANDNNLDYSLSEDVAAVYALAAYDLGPIAFNAGLRYEDTRYEATGRRLVRGAWMDSTTEGGYDDLLPSALLSYKVAPDLVLRAGYSKAIGRPTFNDLAPVGESLNLTTNPVQLTRANPDLQPRRADNYDLTADWYFDNGDGVFSVSVFHKKVEDEIFDAVSSQTLILDGVTTAVDVIQPTNAGKPTDIWGLETNVVKNLTFLPKPFDGLGISFNATWIDSNFQLRMDDGTFVELKTLIGQPKYRYNTAIFYDKGPLSARLAYKYTGERLSFRVNSATAYRNRYNREEERLDFKATWRFADRLALTVNALNLTNDGRGERIGWDQELPMVEAEFGRAAFVGLTFNY